MYEDWRIKVSVLWLFWTVAFLITLMVGLFEPGAIEQIMEGELYGMQLTPELILATTIMMLVPLVMAFLSLTLKSSINRWANVALGIVYTGICLFDWISSLAQPAYGILLYISKIVASALIVWYAWKSRSH
jgi:hypothetical protein